FVSSSKKQGSALYKGKFGFGCRPYQPGISYALRPCHERAAKIGGTADAGACRADPALASSGEGIALGTPARYPDADRSRSAIRQRTGLRLANRYARDDHRSRRRGARRGKSWIAAGHRWL